MIKKVAVLLAEGFEEVEAVTPVDLLRRAGIEVIVAGVGGPEITGSHGIVIKADCLLEELAGSLDGVIIPGGMPGASNIAASGTAMTLIRRVKHSGGLVAAICAAPAVVLGPAGMIAGLRVTGYPSTRDKLNSGTYVDQPVVVDGNVVTSQGAGTAAAFACRLIEILTDKQTADKTAAATLQPGA